MKHRQIKIYSTISLFISVASLIGIFAYMHVRRSAPWIGKFVEQHAIRTARQEPVLTNVFSVLIYTVQDGRTNFSQQGAYYTNYAGKTPSIRLLSTAHLFLKRDKPTSFLVRKLCPLEETPSLCIYRILKIGEEWGEDLDFAECEIGSPKNGTLPVIPCERTLDRSVVDFFTFDQLGKEGAFLRTPLTSLLTGEQVMRRGVALSKNKESLYFVLDYPTLFGHSGECFFDEQKRFYFIVKRSVFSPKRQLQFGLDTESPGLAIGPLKLKTN